MSQQGVSFINQLYKIERSLKGENPDKILSIRQKQSLEIVDAFFVWVKKHRNSVPPKSLLGMAFSYAISQEKKLRVPFENGRLDIDNNRAERSIKPFVIGRKNWLFSQSMKGARASAVIYSIIETAKENNLRPFEYLKYLFEELPSLNKITDDILVPFLPWSQTLPDHIKINSSY